MEALTIGRLKMPVLVVQKSPVALPLTGATTLCGLVARATDSFRSHRYKIETLSSQWHGP
ncbi:hypothetical protein FOT89_13995 [Klebsiella aerogenes]|nr:hypothetical protein AM407_22315 [Klebsiella aerogenes]MBE0177633.1 hypothetical protein [Klebsiella aerogenes]RSW49962.1 hypothetical protein EGH44_10970 [Klebsiella aerogenes]RXX26483.1 hypothetical protein CWC43_20185 [Klebsiella aerogenes]RXX31145.1 hypothetical protein CWC42_04410 [Klebsiella aerogenes]